MSLDLSNKSYIDAVWDSHLQPIFKVKCDIVYDFFGFSLDKNNPYTLTVREYLKKPDLTYSTSKLCEYYGCFQPESAKDVFEGGMVNTTTRKSQGLFCYALPWDTMTKTFNGKKMLYSGPLEDNEGKIEFKRLIRVVDSIKNKGYICKPSIRLYDPGHIQGYFLKLDNEFRFIVLHGKHRAAALIGLGENDIPVTFELSKPRLITLSSIEEWPQVRSGLFSLTEAKEIFYCFFNNAYKV